MPGRLLVLESLSVEVGGSPVLSDVNLSLGGGELHVILGPNAVGKSTLLASIMGLSHVKIRGGRVLFEGRDITGLPSSERARLGISLAYQIPPALRGVRLRMVVEEVARRFGSLDALDEYAELLRVGHLLDREAFRGFSGGERKRVELFITMLQRPKIALLDEPDSGVDIESLKLIASAIRLLTEDRGAGVLLVTHTGEMLREIEGGVGHLMVGGTIAYTGDVQAVVEAVREHGFEKAVEVLRGQG